jgi:RsmE family RNA methyltransferase
LGLQAKGDTEQRKGLVAEAIIKELTKKSALLEIVSKQQSIYPETNFAIAFALLKNKHDELLIEKCTELGAKTFIPLMTDFSVRNPSANTVSRFQRIALAAIKQCRNPGCQILRLRMNMDKAGLMHRNGINGFCSEKMPEAGCWIFTVRALFHCRGRWFREAEFSCFAGRAVVHDQHFAI